jgi:CHAT domain-containing protein
VLVRVVTPGSNAARAGLRSGDVLLSYRGTALNSPADLGPLLTQPGRSRVVFWRDGQRHSASLEPGPLGVVLDRRTAGVAVAAWRRAEELPTRSGRYQALPGTRLEVQALRRLVGSHQTTTLLGRQASQEQVQRIVQGSRLGHFRLIHLATHGHIDEGSPGRSALILGADRQGPGRLATETILHKWRLDSDLVVLSACETGLGAYGGGNGLVGFAHCFLARGARSVVLSRWKVEDTATALLMVRFYENLLGKRVDLKKPLHRAEALAEAKRWLAGLKRQEAEKLAVRLSGGVLRGTEGDARPLVKDQGAKLPEGDRPFAHPFYWASFVLVGDPN